MPLTLKSISVPFIIHRSRTRQFHATLADKASSEFPYPQKVNPTPHEIFHLSPGATQSAIKARYFELVRVHHPDSLHARKLPNSVAQARFQTIGAAYDQLRNGSPPVHRDAHFHEEIKRRAAWAGVGVRDMESRRREAEARADTAWWQRDEALLYVFGMVTLFTMFIHFYTPTPSELVDKQHIKNRQYLSDARQRGREDGLKRRREIRAWLQERNSREGGDDLTEDPPMAPELSGFGEGWSSRRATAARETRR